MPVTTVPTEHSSESGAPERPTPGRNGSTPAVSRIVSAETAKSSDTEFVGEAVDLRKLLGTLRRNIGMILAITAISVGVAWYLASKAEPI